MNVLSLGATFGVLVWVFQEGHLASLLGFDSVGALDATIPLIVFLFAFGLSMDYEVFLLARIKEAWDEIGDNDLAVATGLDRSGRHHHVGRRPPRHRVRRVRRRRAPAHQAARGWDGRGRHRRRHHRPHPARPGDHDAHGTAQLVGSRAAAPLPSSLRPGRDAGCRRTNRSFSTMRGRSDMDAASSPSASDRPPARADGSWMAWTAAGMAGIWVAVTGDQPRRPGHGDRQRTGALPGGRGEHLAMGAGVHRRVCLGDGQAAGRRHATADLDRSHRGDAHRLVGRDDPEREPAGRRDGDRSDADSGRRARRVRWPRRRSRCLPASRPACSSTRPRRPRTYDNRTARRAPCGSASARSSSTSGTRLAPSTPGAGLASPHWVHCETHRVRHVNTSMGCARPGRLIGRRRFEARPYRRRLRGPPGAPRDVWLRHVPTPPAVPDERGTDTGHHTTTRRRRRRRDHGWVPTHVRGRRLRSAAGGSEGGRWRLDPHRSGGVPIAGMAPRSLRDHCPRGRHAGDTRGRSSRPRSTRRGVAAQGTPPGIRTVPAARSAAPEGAFHRSSGMDRSGVNSL